LDYAEWERTRNELMDNLRNKWIPDEQIDKLRKEQIRNELIDRQIEKNEEMRNAQMAKEEPSKSEKIEPRGRNNLEIPNKSKLGKRNKRSKAV